MTISYDYQTWSKEFLINVYHDDDLHGGQRSLRSNVVYHELWLPNLVRRIPDERIMMMTSIKVKGHQRSSMVIYALWLPNLNSDFYGGQRSSEIKCGKPCAIVIKEEEESLMQVYDDNDLKVGQRSSDVKRGNYVL